MAETLILGYGNVDRQDDGVAWHILALLSESLGRPVPSSPDEGFEPAGSSPELLFALQLTPEQSEIVAQFQRVCFVDAHTGNVPEEVHVEVLRSGYQSSPFTHHLTPATCLALAEALYGGTPEAILVSVRGYAFGFERALSSRTQALAGEAVSFVLTWLNSAELSSDDLPPIQPEPSDGKDSTV